jgi:hypothetical protein
VTRAPSEQSKSPYRGARCIPLRPLRAAPLDALVGRLAAGGTAVVAVVAAVVALEVSVVAAVAAAVAAAAAAAAAVAVDDVAAF